MRARRVVTGNQDGKAVVVSDAPAPRTHDFEHTPQMAQSLIWATEPGDDVVAAGRD
jgi:hypothetical protein